jgi:hypothetical protein
MAARYALQQFVYHDTVANAEILIEQGAQRDSLTGQAFLQTPAAFWSTTPLVAGTQTNPALAQYLAVYPAT